MSKRVQLTISYSDCGHFDLDKLSDKVLGAITRAALNQSAAASQNTSYRDVTWKPILEKDDDDKEIPF